MLILIAIVIYFSYQIDFDRVAFGICHFKGVVWNVIGLALVVANAT